MGADVLFINKEELTHLGLALWPRTLCRSGPFGLPRPRGVNSGGPPSPLGETNLVGEVRERSTSHYRRFPTTGGARAQAEGQRSDAPGLRGPLANHVHNLPPPAPLYCGNTHVT